MNLKTPQANPRYRVSLQENAAVWFQAALFLSPISSSVPLPWQLCAYVWCVHGKVSVMEQDLACAHKQSRNLNPYKLAVFTGCHGHCRCQNIAAARWLEDNTIISSMKQDVFFFFVSALISADKQQFLCIKTYISVSAASFKFLSVWWPPPTEDTLVYHLHICSHVRSAPTQPRKQRGSVSRRLPMNLCAGRRISSPVRDFTSGCKTTCLLTVCSHVRRKHMDTLGRRNWLTELAFLSSSHASITVFIPS